MSEPVDPRDPAQAEPTWKTTLPFPRRWLAYLVVKVAVLALVLVVTLRYYGLV
jgi:hypothetical protein